jgi:serine/arginine repetitive matrix protein 2
LLTEKSSHLLVSASLHVLFLDSQPIVAREINFTRPEPIGRSRSGTCTSASSGTETPPLSSDGSSISGDSQSSIDVGHLNVLLSNVTHPFTRPTRRARARGQGHRRRISEVEATRSSVYETIQEEIPVFTSPPPAPEPVPQVAKAEPPPPSVYIVEDTEAADNMDWDEETSVIAMRRYWALKDEAQDTVKESRRVWMDTPFSIFALQCEFYRQ